MFKALILLTVLSLFYGAVWHNKPAREKERATRDSNRKKAPEQNQSASAGTLKPSRPLDR